MEKIGNAIVVEDFTLIAEAWEEVLNKMNFEKIYLFDSATDVIETVAACKPKIILMDINLRGGIDGIQLTEEILAQFSNTKIIIVSMHNELSFIKRAIHAGVSGYVTKSSNIEELRSVILKVLEGQKALSSDISDCIFPLA